MSTKPFSAAIKRRSKEEERGRQGRRRRGMEKMLGRNGKGKREKDCLQAHGAMQSGRVVRKWGERGKGSHVKEVSARHVKCGGKQGRACR